MKKIKTYITPNIVSKQITFKGNKNKSLIFHTHTFVLNQRRRRRKHFLHKIINDFL